MGYTHYWTQKRTFTADEWTEVSDDIRSILSYVEVHLAVPLTNGNGDGGTRPVFAARNIAFNGVGDDSHETFSVSRNRVRLWEGCRLGNDFCKTARKPYDVAVTACLCYLASVTCAYSVSSDGKGPDFTLGLDAARKALPRKANLLDYPLDVMRDDRWTGPWVHGFEGSGYAVRFCIDGSGYVEKQSTKEWYRFDTHESLGRFLVAHRQAVFPRGGSARWGIYDRFETNIWNASGSFDQARHARIARAQRKALAPLFPPDAQHAFEPPAYVRPGDIVTDAPYHYDLSSLIAACDKIRENA